MHSSRARNSNAFHVEGREEKEEKEEKEKEI